MTVLEYGEIGGKRVILTDTFPTALSRTGIVNLAKIEELTCEKRPQSGESSLSLT